MINTEITLRPAVTELTLSDGSITELVSSAVVSDASYYDAAFAAVNAAAALLNDLAETNAFKIDQLQNDLDTTDETAASNYTALDAAKADKSTVATLQALVDTKASTTDLNNAVASLIDAAPESLNTFKEVYDRILADEGGVDALNTAVANRVRFDAAQSLTTPQQDQARSNINAEKVGVAATLVAAVTTSSIGAATAAQGAKADSAIQSGDLAPVALSGSFTSLINKSAVFNLVYSAYMIGSNVGILATDTLGEMLGKLQAQVNAKLDAAANAVSATKLVTARNINGVAFDGTSNITIVDSSKEPAITADLVSKFWSGTKTFRDLATDVRDVVLTGLSTGTGTAITAADTILSALGKLQNQASTNATAITGKEPTITATTSADYYRGDKTFVSFATTVRATVLTGLSTATGTVITTTDTVLSALGSLQNQITNKTVDTLSNVVITSKASNDMLKWDGTTSKWVNIPIPVGTAGTSLSRKTNSISSSSGTLTIDLSGGYEIFNVTLTENITTITITNPPASGFTAEFAIVFTQAAGAYTIVNPASGKWHGGFSPISSVNGAVESWGFRVNSSGTIIGAFQAGVQA